MKKRDVMDLMRAGRGGGRHYKTAEFIVVHAKWQKSRGRKPSESYLEEVNPRKALYLAMDELRSYSPSAGECISYTADRIARTAAVTGITVTAHFNDIPLEAKPGVTADEIVQSYSEQSERRHLAYRESPEGQRAVEEAEMYQRGLQVLMDLAMAELPALDFSNLKAVIAWLEKVRDPSDHSGVVTPHEEIVQAFHDHGFEPDVNNGEDFNGEDEDNCARWLIGQALHGLRDFHAIHQVFHHFAEEWRKKFGHAG